MAEVTLTPKQREILAEEIDQLVYAHTDTRARHARKALEFDVEFNVMAQLGWFSEEQADRSNRVKATDLRRVATRLLQRLDDHLDHLAEEFKQAEDEDSEWDATCSREEWLAVERETFAHDLELRREMVAILKAAEPQMPEAAERAAVTA
jgi:hypothetical protein